MRPEDYLDRLAAEPGAVELSKEAVEAFPDDERILRARAIILRQAARRTEAVNHLRAVILRLPMASWAYAQLGLVTDPPQSIGHFRRALSLEPANRDYRLALIHALARYMGDGSDPMLEEAYQLLRPMLAGASGWPQNDLHIAYHVLSRVCAWDELEALGDPGRKWAEAGNHTALLLRLGHIAPGLGRPSPAFWTEPERTDAV